MTRLQALGARWIALPPRERRLLGWAAVVVLAALVWWLALAPALRTLSAAPAEHARLDAQLQRMSTLAAQARALQAQPKASREDAQRALEAGVRQQLGPNAQFGNAGALDGANVIVRAVPADVLAPWLAQARGNARALPREVHLTRAQPVPVMPFAPPPPSPAGTTVPGAVAGIAATAANGEAARIRWDGTLVMSLPAR